MDSEDGDTATYYSSSVEIIASNDGILTEIFLQLPAKSLIRFKSVSKRWRDLISDHRFCRLHTLRNSRPQTSFLLSTFHDEYFFYFDPNTKNLIPHKFPFYHNNSVRIVNSCSGLLLVECFADDNRRYYLDDPFGDENCCLWKPEGEYYIYNATTRQSKKLPLMDHGMESITLEIGLAYDPLKSKHFKVVCIRQILAREYHQVEVYESESDTWVVVVEQFVIGNFGCNPVVYWNGGVLWFLPEKHSIYFDVDNRVLAESPVFVPELLYGVEYPLFESYDGLYFVNKYWKSYFQIHRLKRGGSMSCVAKLDRENDCVVLGLVRREGEEGCILLFHGRGKIMAYDLCGESFEEFVDATANGENCVELGDPLWELCFEERLKFDGFDSCQYVETLAPIF